MSPVQWETAVYVLSGNNQVVVGSSWENVSETHQLLILWEEREFLQNGIHLHIHILNIPTPYNAIYNLSCFYTPLC